MLISIELSNARIVTGVLRYVAFFANARSLHSFLSRVFEHITDLAILF